MAKQGDMTDRERGNNALNMLMVAARHINDVEFDAAIKVLNSAIQTLTKPEMVGGWTVQRHSGHWTLRRDTMQVSISKYGGDVKLFQPDNGSTSLLICVFEAEVLVQGTDEEMMAAAVQVVEEWLAKQ